MKSVRLVRDYKNRYFYKKLEVNKKLINVLFFFNIHEENVIFLLNLLQKKLVHKFRIKNYCISTGRARGVYRDFKVSRIALRELGAKGMFFGLKKNS